MSVLSPDAPGTTPHSATPRPEWHEMLVSVIIPCYRQAHFVGEAIESALEQTYPHVEVIVVDDGSPDDVAGVVARYTAPDLIPEQPERARDVRYLRQPNGGLSAARNTGVRASWGRYLVFLDADDRLLPDALERGLACFRRHPDAAFVAGAHRLMDPDGTAYGPPRASDLTTQPYLALLQGNVIGMHAAVMYRRSALVEAGGFDASLPACEDYDLYLRLARHQRVASHPAVVAEYRRHEAGMSRHPGRMLAASLRVHRAQRKHLATPAHRQAYRRGTLGWQTLYGKELGGQIRDRLTRQGLDVGAFRDTSTLLRYAPLWTLRHTLRTPVPPLLKTLKDALPRPLRRAQARMRDVLDVPPPGRVNLGDLRRLAPISNQFGFDRGRPVDRYYIEAFLDRHSADIRGHVLEIGDDAYTRRFGSDQVERSSVLDVVEGDHADFVADLTQPDALPPDTFDSILFTQTLQVIYDMRTALATLYHALKPGGVLLVTCPGISQVDRATEAQGTWQSTWALTDRAARKLFRETFPASGLTVETHGNVLAATALLHGLAAEELTSEELDHCDEDYQVVITIRAMKPEETEG
ncbi:MAG: glycosyltransferase [Rhodothermales bacterium]